MGSNDRELDWYARTRYLYYRDGECKGWEGAPGDPWEGRRFAVRVDRRPRHHKPQTKTEKSGASDGVMAPGSLLALSLPELAALVSRGCSVLPGVCEGRRTPDAWVSQELFFIDVDNDEAARANGYAYLPYTYAVERAFCYGLPLAMSYESFGSTCDPGGGQRYRLVFAAPREIRDKEEAARFASGLLAAYPEADRTTVQCNRLFYGTDKEVCVWGRL